MQPHEMSDSQRVAEWSIQATQEGRYELAEQLLKIAMQAYRAEKAAGAQGEPAPLRLVPDPAQDNRAAFLPAATAFIPIPRNPDPVETPAVDRRCRASVINGGIETECHAAVFWEHVGHRWHHVDPSLDQDHYVAVRDGA